MARIMISLDYVGLGYFMMKSTRNHAVGACGKHHLYNLIIQISLVMHTGLIELGLRNIMHTIILLFVCRFIYLLFTI